MYKIVPKTCNTVADFLPSAWFTWAAWAACTTGACAKDGEAPRIKPVYAQLEKRETNLHVFRTILYIKIYIGR